MVETDDPKDKEESVGEGETTPETMLTTETETRKETVQEHPCDESTVTSSSHSNTWSSGGESYYTLDEDGRISSYVDFDQMKKLLDNFVDEVRHLIDMLD